VQDGAVLAILHAVEEHQRRMGRLLEELGDMANGGESIRSIDTGPPLDPPPDPEPGANPTAAPLPSFFGEYLRASNGRLERLVAQLAQLQGTNGGGPPRR
jgi:hypothetical protein